MKPLKSTLLFFGIFIFFGCDGGYELTNLYVQKIENSTDRIIYYEAWSTLNDGSKFGYDILKKGEKIKIEDAAEMPFKLFYKMPKHDSLFMVKNIKNGSPKYISTENKKYKNTDLKIVNYQFNESPMNMEFEFSEIRELKNKIKITGIKKKYFYWPMEKNELIFPKGNIKLIAAVDDLEYLERIEFYAFFLNKYTGGVIDSLTIIKEKKLDAQYVLFKFYPTEKIKINEFSDYGFYKPEKLINVKMLQ